MYFLFSPDSILYAQQSESYMKLFYSLLLFFIFSVSFTAQEKAPVKLSGVVFADYFYNIDQYADSLKDFNGFQFRRIFFTVDYTISDIFSSRFRLEADQSALTSNGRIGVFVKDAYLKWQNIFSGSDLIAGISPTPSFQVSEEVWSYRSLEKTIMDLRGIVASRDFGLDLKGKLNSAGSVNYWIKIANNSGNSPENNKFKRYYGLLHFKPSKITDITLSGDYDTRAGISDPAAQNTKNNDRVTGAVFAGIKQPGSFALGVESYFRNSNNNYKKPGTDKLITEKAAGLSLFGWFALSERFNYVARVDVNDPNSDRANDATLYMITGLDYRPHPNVSIIPNIIAQFYQNKNQRDLVGRVTLNLSL